MAIPEPEQNEKTIPQGNLSQSIQDKVLNRLQDKVEDIQNSDLVQKTQQTAVAKKFLTPLKDFLIKFTHDWTISMQAGALSYNFLVAIIPIVIALLAIFDWLLGSIGQQSQSMLLDTLGKILPGSIASGMKEAIQGQKLGNATSVLSIVALFTAIFGGSRLFVLMEHCFDLTYRQKPRPFLSQNVMAIGMILLFALLIPIIVLASSLPPILLKILDQTLKNVPGKGFLFYAVGTLSSLLVSWIFFEAVYIIVPNQHISFKNSWRGAIFAAVAMQIYLSFFPIYATHFLGGHLGQVGFAIILVVFFYYFSIILLIGVQINAFFGEDLQQNQEDLTQIIQGDATQNRSLRQGETVPGNAG